MVEGLTIAEIVAQHPEDWVEITIQYRGQRARHWVEVVMVEDAPAIASFIQRTLQGLRENE